MAFALIGWSFGVVKVETWSHLVQVTLISKFLLLAFLKSLFSCPRVTFYLHFSFFFSTKNLTFKIFVHIDLT